MKRRAGCGLIVQTPVGKLPWIGERTIEFDLKGKLWIPSETERNLDQGVVHNCPNVIESQQGFSKLPVLCANGKTWKGTMKEESKEREMSGYGQASIDEGSLRYRKVYNDRDDSWPVAAGTNPLLPDAALSSVPKILQHASHRAQALAEKFLHATFTVMNSSAEIKVFKRSRWGTISICERRNPPEKLTQH